MELKQNECNRNKTKNQPKGCLFWEVFHDLTPQEELPLLILGSESVSGILERPPGCTACF